MTVVRRLKAQAPSLDETHVLGMAEMGFRGLSEQWLMRRAGDLHWRLLAEALGQRDAVFRCADGQPLYATFLASSLRISAPELPRLCGKFSLSARLWAIGRSRSGSEHVLRCDGRPVGVLRLISTFAGHRDPASNRSMVRRMPAVMAALPEAPTALQRLARQAGVISRHLGPLQFAGRRILMRPCPATDFNAAGLLYFPSFAALTDRCDFATEGRNAGYLTERHVIYAGNVEFGEAVDVTFRDRANGHLAQLRGSDGRALALLSTRFRPCQPAAGAC